MNLGGYYNDTLVKKTINSQGSHMKSPKSPKGSTKSPKSMISDFPVAHVSFDKFDDDTAYTPE
jgi:hypothetical protein